MKLTKDKAEADNPMDRFSFNSILYISITIFTVIIAYKLRKSKSSSWPPWRRCWQGGGRRRSPCCGTEGLYQGSSASHCHLCNAIPSDDCLYSLSKKPDANFFPDAHRHGRRPHPWHASAQVRWHTWMKIFPKEDGGWTCSSFLFSGCLWLKRRLCPSLLLMSSSTLSRWSH